MIEQEHQQDQEGHKAPDSQHIMEHLLHAEVRGIERQCLLLDLLEVVHAGVGSEVSGADVRLLRGLDALQQV